MWPHHVIAWSENMLCFKRSASNFFQTLLLVIFFSTVPAELLPDRKKLKTLFHLSSHNKLIDMFLQNKTIYCDHTWRLHWAHCNQNVLLKMHLAGGIHTAEASPTVGQLQLFLSTPRCQLKVDYSTFILKLVTPYGYKHFELWYTPITYV